MAYTFFARVKDFIIIILPICFSDERDKCKMKPGNNVFGCKMKQGNNVFGCPP